MPEILIRAAKRIPPLDWRGIPAAIRNDGASAICRTKQECQELVKWFGDADFCPFPPVLIVLPSGDIIRLAGQGCAPAAELRDNAVYIWELKTERLEKTGTLVDFDELREKGGLMRRENVDAAIREALWERTKMHKASPRTDPPRQFDYPRLNNRTVFPMGDAVLNKGESN